MSLIKRREFLIKSAIATAGFAAGCTSTRILGSNDSIRIGVIGVGGKGCRTARDVTGIAGARLVALADPDPEYKMGACRDKLAIGENPVNVDIYTDFRRLLDRKDIDAVIIASCNHWHSHHTIYALQAGKHVYVEKPVSHDVWQGRLMVNLAQKSGLVVQSGLQHRSRNCWPEVMAYLEESHLGKIICARALCYKRRKSIGLLSQPAKPPKGCDYNLWLGPAQDLPLMRPEFHYDWHWVWNTGNGDLGNQAVHQLDIARWLIGEKSYPNQVFSIGGRFGYKDAGITANTQFIYYDYKPVPLIAEVRGLPDKPAIEAMSVYKKSRVSTLIECEGGYISDNVAYDKDGKKIRQFSGHGQENHLPGFIKAIRNQNPQSVPCSIEDGHISAALCHIGNISHRVGNLTGPKEISEKVHENALQYETWQRVVQHLANNSIDLNTNKITFGPKLRFDPSNEKFIGSGSEQANALLKNNYRGEWMIPEIV
jgi:predicted dehydrogenase